MIENVSEINPGHLAHERHLSTGQLAEDIPLLRHNAAKLKQLSLLVGDRHQEVVRRILSRLLLKLIEDFLKIVNNRVIFVHQVIDQLIEQNISSPLQPGLRIAVNPGKHRIDGRHRLFVNGDQVSPRKEDVQFSGLEQALGIRVKVRPVNDQKKILGLQAIPHDGIALQLWPLNLVDHVLDGEGMKTEEILEKRVFGFHRSAEVHPELSGGVVKGD